MHLRLLVLTLVLQVLLVSCETTTSASKDIVSGQSASKNENDKYATPPVRSSGKTARFVIRRARPQVVTFNVVKTPLQTLGFDNRIDNGALITDSPDTTAAQESRPTNATTAAAATSSVESQSKVAIVDSKKMQAKSDIIDYGSLSDDQQQYQPLQHQHHQHHHKAHTPLYEYNTMHASATPYQVEYQQDHRGQAQKYSEPPKLEYLHAYQFAEEQQEPEFTSGQEILDEYSSKQPQQQRLAPQLEQLEQLQLQQPQEQVSEVEISKSKQFSYTLRKPEHSSFHTSFTSSSSFAQPQAAPLQQQPQQALYQPQTNQFGSFGRETAYLKQTPSTVVPQLHQHQHEEFKFQRINRPPVEKEVVSYEEDTKPVHIHHHYPVQHIEETETPESQPLQQAPQFSQQFQSQSPVRSQFYPSVHSGSAAKSPFSATQFPVAAEPEPTQKSFSHGFQQHQSPQQQQNNHHHHHHNHHHQTYIPSRKPTKSWQTTPSYEAPTTKSPPPPPPPQSPPKWENPHHSESHKQHREPAVNEEDQDRPQVVYPNNIRIEIPEEEIYKHIQNSVHQIIRDLKEKRTKDQNTRGKPLAAQDQSWSKFLMQDENKKEKPSRPLYNKTSFDPFHSKPVEREQFVLDVNPAVNEKPREQPFHQFLQQQQQQQHHQAPQQQLYHQRINSRQQEEEKPFGQNNNKVHSFRFEEGYNTIPQSTRMTDATQYEGGYPRDTISSTVDLTMKNPKKAPIIDLNALDVGQTWNHGSHFESQELKNEQAQNFFNSGARLTGSASTTNHQFQSVSNMTNPFASFEQRTRETPPRVQSNNNFHHDSNGNTMAYVGSAINVKDSFPSRSATATPSYFKASQPGPEIPEVVPEVDIMHGLLPVVNQFDNGNRVMKVILDPSKMPRELVSDVNPNVFQQEFSGQLLPGNVQTIQYNANHQNHLSIPIVQNNNKQQQQSSYVNQIPDQQSYVSYPKERKEMQQKARWSNNMPEGSANVIQYLPPPPLPASRSLLPYDSYSPIYVQTEDMNHQSLGKAVYHSLEGSSTIMRNKRHRGSEEYKKIIRTYPRNGKKVKTVKILEPSTEMRPPPKFNKFNKKSSTL